MDDYAQSFGNDGDRSQWQPLADDLVALAGFADGFARELVMLRHRPRGRRSLPRLLTINSFAQRATSKTGALAVATCGRISTDEMEARREWT